MNKVPVRCVLFDLDDTLLRNSWAAAPSVMMKALLALREKVGTIESFKILRVLGKARFGNGENIFNQERFVQAIASVGGLTREESSYFVNEKFLEIISDSQRHFSSIIKAKEFLKSIPNHVSIVLATNPVLNEACTNMRIKWAGLSNTDFKLVTHSQNMHHSKPQLMYYEEILSRLSNEGISREDCIFIGNDPKNDGVAIQAGISTVLISERSKNIQVLKRGVYDSYLYRASWALLPQLIRFAA